MSKQIIINTDSQKTRIAIVEDGDLAELFIETDEHERTLGNLFLGRVRRIMPSIQAAFVDIGQKQDAFLHFSDLSDNLADWLAYLGEEVPQIGQFKPQHLATHKGRKRRRPLHGRRHDTDAADDPEEEEDDEFELEDEEDESGEGSARHAMPDAKSRGRRRSMQRRRGSRDKEEDEEPAPEGPPVHTLLQRDQAVLVKISKEPIAQKGSRITTDISLAGRFLVLVPMANYVAVSKKIASFKERRRLRALAKSLLPDAFGVIVRTVAQNQTAKTLDTDLRLLVERWRKIESRLAGRPKAPVVVHEDVNMVSSVIRDLFSDHYDRILVDNQRLYRNVKSYVQAVAPEMAVSVQFHDSGEPVFRTAGIDRKVAEAFERRINLASGAYLFFEQTEAMHVIDVNSGRAGKGLSQEESSLKVNLEAARVIARQIRLRDLGGIIVVDFIDLRSERSRRKVLDELKKEFRRDRAVTKILPMSDFGLIQITRQRLRPSITTTFSQMHSAAATGAAPAGGDGASRTALPSTHVPEALTPEALLQQIEDWMRVYRRAGHRAPVRLVVHPFVAAYLNRRLPSQSTRWFLRFGQRVRIDSDPDSDVVSWRMVDAATEADVTLVPEPAKAAPREPDAPREQRSGRRGRGGRDQRRQGDGRSRDFRGRGESGSSGRGRTAEEPEVAGSGASSRGEPGDKRPGARESGERRSKGRETGDKRPGTRESGDRRSESRETGDQRRGPRESGERRSEGRETGDKRPGTRESGDRRRAAGESGGRESPAGEQATKGRAARDSQRVEPAETGSTDARPADPTDPQAKRSRRRGGRGRGGRGRGGRRTGGEPSGVPAPTVEPVRDGGS